MSRYATIVGSNGYKYSAESRCELGESIIEYRSAKKTISCVAVGPKRYFAVVCKDGCSYFSGADDFELKMKKINGKNIKHITFGCDDQWAITLKNGKCCYSLLQNGKCLKCVEEHDGNIMYVSLCDNESAWIVGYGDNLYDYGTTVSSELISFLDGINASKKKINLVEIGSCNDWFVHHQHGRRWRMDYELSDWFENVNSSFSAISLYEEVEYDKLSKMEIMGNKLAELERKNNAMNTENEKLKTQINRLNGNDTKQMNLNDLYELRQSMQNTVCKIEKQIEERHKNGVLCITCLENQQEILFQPCHHLVMCLKCLNKLNTGKCPMCQTPINNKIKIFRSS